MITTRTGTVVHSRYVIVAMAPTLYGRLEWDPPLPPILQQAVQRMPMGSCIKTHMFYRTAWWRERGYSGSFSAMPAQLRTRSTTASRMEAARASWALSLLVNRSASQG